MTLIACPECADRVSDLALACPHCGYPVQEQNRPPENQLVVLSPRFFNGNAFMHVPTVLLCLVVVGFFVYLSEWVKHRSTRLVITSRRTILTHGIFEKHSSEVYHTDVRNLQVNQSFLQRVCNAGNIELSSAAQGDVEIVAKGFPDPDAIAKLIWDQRQAAEQGVTRAREGD